MRSVLGGALTGVAIAAALQTALPLSAMGGELAAVPEPAGPVVDQAGVLPPGVRAAIRALAKELERKTGAEIAVLTVASTAPEEVFGYGLRVAERWKLGKAPADNGLLLVVAVQDRKLHFFTGYGLEGILPDGRIGELRDAYLVPSFRRGDYAGGIYGALRAAAEIIAADAGVALTGEPARPRRTRRRGGLAPLLLLPLLLLSGGLGRRRRSYAPIFFGGGLGLGGFGGGFGGAGRGGFGGGGFGGGGFGGGGFGGGGAGGSW